jgi:ATP:ADP antiporter, AAA family
MLTRWLGIRPEDRRDTGVAFATLTAMLCAHSMLETARDALFLAKLPPSRLPLAYIAIAILALFVSRVNQVAAQRFARRRLLSMTLVGGGAVTAIFWYLTQHREPWVLIALYVWTGVLATVVVVQFWLQLADVLDVTQAKRLFGLIGAGGLVGATLGSATAGALLTRMDARAILLVSAIIQASAAFVPLGFSHTKEADAPKRRRHAAPQAPARSVGAMLRDRYLLRLFVMSLVGAVLFTGIDYVFKAKVVSEAHARGWELGGFFARYYAVVNATALLVQLFIAPRLLRAMGVNRALLVMPFLLLLGSTGFALTAGLVPALLLKGSDGALRHSVHRTASEILFLPLSRPVRDRFKAFAEAVGQRGGQALASVVILGATTLAAPPQFVAWGVVVLAVGWVASIVGHEKLYLELFKKQLRDGTLDTEVDLPDLDLASFEVLVQGLSSEDDREVIAALEMFDSYGKVDLLPALILYHPSHEVVLRAFEVLGKSTRQDVRRLTGRLLKHEDGEIRAAALRAMAASSPDEELLRKHVFDESSAVRCTALVALIAHGLVEGDEASATLRAIVGGPNPDERLALARTLRYLPVESYGWVAGELVALDEPGLAGAVARSLAAAPHERHLDTLVDMLQNREARADARVALVALGDVAFDRLCATLHDRDAAPHIRRHLPRTLSRFPIAAASDVLLAALVEEEDDAVLFKILRGVGRMRAQDPTMPIDRGAIVGVAKRILEGAVRALHWRLTVGQVVARQQEAMTPAAELLVAYLDEKRDLALERLFRLLHILEPAQELRLIYEGVRSADPKARASSLELLTHVAPPSIRDGLLPLCEETPPRARLRNVRAWYDPPGRARFAELWARLEAAPGDPKLQSELGVLYADTLREMLHDRSEALRGIVAHHVAELGLEELRTQIVSAAKSKSDVLAEISDDAMGVLGMRGMEPSGAG